MTRAHKRPGTGDVAMTKSNQNSNFSSEYLDPFRSAHVWATQFHYPNNDYRYADDNHDHEEKVDQFRRKIPECQKYADDNHDNEEKVDQFRRKIPECQKYARDTEPVPERKTHHGHIEHAESLGAVWNYFCRQTTCHGVKSIVSEERLRFSKLVWLLSVLGMTGGLLYTVAILLIEYYQYNTVTSTDVKITEWSTFPSVTLCNTCPFKNVEAGNDTAIFKLIAMVSDLKSSAFQVNFSDPDMKVLMATDILEVQNKYVYTAEDLFLRAQYEKKDINISDAFEVIETSLGRCFTFNGPEYIFKNGPRVATQDGRESGLRVYARLNQDKYFIFRDLTAGIRMFIAYHPDTPRLRKDGVDIHPGTSTRIAINPIKYTFQPAPYRSYGDDYCEVTDSKDLRHKMVNASFYSYNNCLEQCLSYRASLNCSCYTHLLYVPNLPSCTVGIYLNCFSKIRESLKPESCDCPRPCSFTLYDTTMSASQMPSSVSAEYLREVANATSTPDLREDYLEIRVFLETMMFKHEKHEPQYTSSSIFAFLGGQMGFFVGASLITLAELLEAIVLSVFVFIHKLLRMGQASYNSQVKPTKT